MASHDLSRRRGSPQAPSARCPLLQTHTRQLPLCLTLQSRCPACNRIPGTILIPETSETLGCNHSHQSLQVYAGGSCTSSVSDTDPDCRGEATEDHVASGDPSERSGVEMLRRSPGWTQRMVEE